VAAILASTHRHARGVYQRCASLVTSSPDTARDRPRERAFCRRRSPESSTVRSRSHARHTTNAHCTKPPSAATAMNLATNRPRPSRRTTIVPPSRTHSNALVTRFTRWTSARLDRLPFDSRAAILKAIVRAREAARHAPSADKCLFIFLQFANCACLLLIK